jgi:hypothetical protein
MQKASNKKPAEAGYLPSNPSNILVSSIPSIGRSSMTSEVLHVPQLMDPMYGFVPLA